MTHRKGTITPYEWAIAAFDSYPENPTRLFVWENTDERHNNTFSQR